MIIIIAGNLILKPGLCNKFIEALSKAILKTPKPEECEDFSVSPDPIDENTINIFEKWESHNPLNVFRNSGSENNLFSPVESSPLTLSAK